MACISWSAKSLSQTRLRLLHCQGQRLQKVGHLIHISSCSLQIVKFCIASAKCCQNTDPTAYDTVLARSMLLAGAYVYIYIYVYVPSDVQCAKLDSQGTSSTMICRQRENKLFGNAFHRMLAAIRPALTPCRHLYAAGSSMPCSVRVSPNQHHWPVSHREKWNFGKLAKHLNKRRRMKEKNFGMLAEQLETKRMRLRHPMRQPAKAWAAAMTLVGDAKCARTPSKMAARGSCRWA